MISALYDDYMELVSEEATLKMVAEIIQRMKKKISEIVSRERQQHRFPFDKELGVLEADLKDVEADIAAIGKRKEEVKQRLLCATSVLLGAVFVLFAAIAFVSLKFIGYLDPHFWFGSLAPVV